MYICIQCILVLFCVSFVHTSISDAIPFIIPVVLAFCLSPARTYISHSCTVHWCVYIILYWRGEASSIFSFYLGVEEDFEGYVCMLYVDEERLSPALDKLLYRLHRSFCFYFDVLFTVFAVFVVFAVFAMCVIFN
jgi:hypothetical protein